MTNLLLLLCLKVLEMEMLLWQLALFEQLCSCHGGHGSHGRRDGGHRDVFEDGLCGTGVGYFGLAECPNDHLAHFPAGITAHRQQCLNVLLPVESREDKKTQYCSITHS